MMRRAIVLVALVWFATHAGLAAALPQTPAAAPAPNTLTAAERAAGWTLLFDGKNIADPIPEIPDAMRMITTEESVCRVR